MTRWLTAMGVLALLWGATACSSRKAACDGVCKRLRECAKEVGQEEANRIQAEKGDPADAIEAARQARRAAAMEWYRDTRDCLSRCLRRVPGHEYDRARKCLRYQACYQFAKCFVETMR